MLSPQQAVAEILARIEGLVAEETVPIATAVGRVLAEEVVSDIDLPPFDRSAMDGYAVRAADLPGGAEGPPGGERTLPIVGESRAGEPFRGRVPEGTCIAIYTGAEVPPDCDAVVMVEETERRNGDVTIRARPSAGQHIAPRGQDLRVGLGVLTPGHRLRAADLSVLASVGCDPVPVYRRPRAAILTTGDELLPPSQRPGPGQIREGNTLHLAAMVAAAGAEPRNLGIVRDDPAELERSLATALEDCDVLLTTGGVSMGRYDLVGEVLERLGVEPVFHKVAIKPGKPIWFGMRGRQPVFALPGNPVSCLVGHEVFVRPALARMGGASAAEVQPEERLARWNGSETVPNRREQYVPSLLLQGRDGHVLVEPVRWNGSGDVVGLSRSSALAVIPADRSVARGELVRYLPLA